MERELNGEQLAEVKPPSLNEVLQRPFQKPDSQYRVVSALLSRDGPLAGIIPEAAKAPNKQFDSSFRLQPSDELAQNVLTVICNVTGRTPDSFRKEITHKTGEDIQDEEKRVTYLGYLERGIELFVNHGYLSQETVDMMRRTFLDPAALQLVDRDFSDFSYRNYDFPDKPLGINLSPVHIAGCESSLKKELADANLTERLTNEQIHTAAAHIALMHEFGHGVSFFFLTSLTQKLARDAGDEWAALDHSKKWAYFEQAYDQFFEMTEDVVADGRSDMLKTVLTEDEIRSTYTEGVAVGAENIALSLVLEDFGLSKEERDNVMTIVAERDQQNVQDFLYFADVIKKTGLGRYQYEALINQASLIERYAGYDIDRALPFYNYGLNGKQTGYYMPIPEDRFKPYTETFQRLLSSHT